jgi:molybdenum cofactor biosynthesis enzyme MoaA
MEPINLEPRYSSKNIPGKCIKCLAEQELNSCLRELLRGEVENKELQQRFEMLVSFLKSPESQRLRDESEKYLAEGKHVTVRVYFDKGKPRYELKIDDKNGGAKS